jgi:hypothetical protein
VHATRIKDGKASFCNHFVRTHRFKEEQRAGFPLYAKVSSSRLQQPSAAALSSSPQQQPSAAALSSSPQPFRGSRHMVASCFEAPGIHSQQLTCHNVANGASETHCQLP